MSKPKVQIFYSHEGVTREATPVDPDNKNPIKQAVDVMRKVELNSAEAQQNEMSMKDKNGERIKFEEERLKKDKLRDAKKSNNTFITFRGVEDDRYR